MISAMSIEELRGAREAWARVAAAEAALPSDLALADRVRIFELMDQSCRSLMEATDDLFSPQRQAEMIGLQARLRRLADLTVSE